MKNNEKYTVGYSVLNPATNSDSDSTKSNGARVVSPSIHISTGSIVNSMIFNLLALIRSGNNGLDHLTGFDLVAADTNSIRIRLY